jgi:hypothetical protein
VGQREHMVRQGFTRKEGAGLSFCVLVAISPRRAKLGGFPRGMRSLGRHPSAGPRRWRRTAGGAVAGAQLGIEPLDHKPNVIKRLPAG